MNRSHLLYGDICEVANYRKRESPWLTQSKEAEEMRKAATGGKWLWVLISTKQLRRETMTRKYSLYLFTREHLRACWRYENRYSRVYGEPFDNIINPLKSQSNMFPRTPPTGTASLRKEEGQSQEQPFGRDMIHLVEGQGRGRSRKKRREKKGTATTETATYCPAYRYSAQPALREGSQTRSTHTRREEKKEP